MRPRNVIVGQKVAPVKAARAKELRRGQTKAEGILWEALRRNQLRGLHFRRQQVISGLIADFYCHEAGLVVEVDGISHEGRSEYDEERDRVLTAQGFRVVRVSNTAIEEDLAGVLSRIVDLTPNPFPIREGEKHLTPTPSRHGKG